jgi:hypothetical protein
LGFCTDKTSVSVPLCLAFYYWVVLLRDVGVLLSL